MFFIMPARWYRANKGAAKHTKKDFNNLSYDQKHTQKKKSGGKDLTMFLPQETWMEKRALKLVMLEDMPPKEAKEKAKSDWCCCYSNK